MAFDVSALSNYTNEPVEVLLVKPLFSGKTISMMEKQTGIKSAETINIVAASGVWQADSCGFSASGETVFTQRTITVGKIKVNLDWCPKDLESKYTQKALAKGSSYDTIAFMEEIVGDVEQNITSKMETVVWQGDTTSGDAYLSRFDGLIKIIDAAAGVVDATPQASISTSTVRGIFENIFTLIPVAIINAEDLRCFCGWDTFRTLIVKLTTDNLFHYTTDGKTETGEITYPGTNLKIVAVHGLNSKNRIFAMRTSNMYFGTDLENEQEQYEVFFAKEAQKVRYIAAWKAGVQVAFPDHIVSYQNT